MNLQKDKHMMTPENETETTNAVEDEAETSLSSNEIEDLEDRAYEHFWNYLDESMRSALRYAGWQGVLRALHSIASESFGEDDDKTMNLGELAEGVFEGM
jgi:hypothetical protein